MIITSYVYKHYTAILGHLLDAAKYTACKPWQFSVATVYNTVDSRYLEIQGTLWNTSRYPYFDISDLRNWGKQLIEQSPLTEWIFNLTPKLAIYWKYCGKEEKEQFSSFPQYFVACW